jgi:N-acetylglucosamine-6-phosphate deacetylase
MSETKKTNLVAIRGNLHTPDIEINDGVVIVQDGKIQSIIDQGSLAEIPSSALVLDHRGKRVIPGLIDTHIHGAGGFEMTGKGVADVANYLPSHGITSFLATTHFLISRKKLLQVVVEIADAIESKTNGAVILGIHMEGPWVSPDRSPFSKPKFCYPITREDILAFQQASRRNLRMITFAPELLGALEIIPWLREQNIIPSVGHTNASYDIVKKAVDSGLNHSTHTFNAMQPLHHRQPGTVGAILDFEQIIAELIGDGFHVQAPIMRLLIKAKGVDKVCLVSDAVPLAGMPTGTQISWHGFKIGTNGEISTLPDGRPAGAYKLLNQHLKVLVDQKVVTFNQALATATRVPANMLGLNKGQLKAGFDADLVILEDNYQPILTMVAGKIVFENQLR